MSSRSRAAANAAFASLVAWCSSGAIALRGPGGARIGLLPGDAVALGVAAAAGAAVLAASRRDARGTSIAIAPLVILLLPWLPGGVPPAFLIWTGALTVPVWLGVGLALLAGARLPDLFAGASARRGIIGAALAGCAVFSLAAWSASASIPGGDEPHYLVITQSLLYDHDLQIENNHARGDYHAYFGGPLAPDFRARGRHGEIYSIHAPGVPALVLPAFAIGGYRAVVVFLIALSAAACALAWWLAWRVTGSAAAAWFGWAVVALSAPWLLDSFTVYPDGPGAAAVLTGFWALCRLEWERDGGAAVASARRRWLVWVSHGAALAVLPWLHTRFALLAAALGVLIVVRLLRGPQAAVSIAAFLSVPIVSAAAWLGFFYLLYGTPSPGAPYGSETDSALSFLPNGIGGLLFDQGFGLLATAPALAVALAGFTRARRFALEWGVTAIVYGVAVGAYAMWWAGLSGPARFLVPLIPPLAIPAACAWRTYESRGARALMLTALVVGTWLSMVMAAGGGGLLGYHGRNGSGLTAAPWLEWANPLVDLSQALPAFVPLPAGTPLDARIAAAHAGFAATVPWAVCMGAAAMLVIALGRRRTATFATLVAMTTAMSAAAVMIAASIVWWTHASRPVTVVPAQLDALRRLAGGRTVALDLSSGRYLPSVDALKMRIEIPVEPDERSPATLASVPLLPAGSFVVSARGAVAGPVSVFAGSEDEPLALSVASPAAFARGFLLELPVAIRALTIRADTAAGVGAIEIRPAAPHAPRASDGVAHHAATYGETSVFFLDDRTAPEADGFWIWGAREGAVVFRGTADEVPLVIRGGAVENDVSLRTGDREQHLTLRPGEEHAVTIPASYLGKPSVTYIRTSTGFRPADVDPHSQDHRFLGVYVVMTRHVVR